MAFGYVEDLISDEIADPIAYYLEFVKQKNAERTASLAEETRLRAFRSPVEKHIGHFLIYSLLEELNVKETIDILASQKRFQFDLYDMITQLIYARILYPCSKSKTVSTVFPRLYNGVSISEDQVYNGCAFIGESYKKYIELFNHCYEEHYKRDFSSVFFDCTNYYFEIDLPSDDKQKGPSKENKHEPIIGQALLLDADLVPLAMQNHITPPTVTAAAQSFCHEKTAVPGYSGLRRFPFLQFKYFRFFLKSVSNVLLIGSNLSNIPN